MGASTMDLSVQQLGGHELVLFSLVSSHPQGRYTRIVPFRESGRNVAFLVRYNEREYKLTALFLRVKIDLYRLREQVTPNDEPDSSLGIMLVMHREYAYS